MINKKNEKLKWQTDIWFNSVWGEKFINKFILKGKKTLVERHLLNSFILIKKNLGKEPILLLEKTLKVMRPLFDYTSKRIGTKFHLIPGPISIRRQISIALTWTVSAIKNQAKKPLTNRVFNEFNSLLFNQQNTLIKIRNAHYEKLNENRNNIRYRWK